jgi:NAD(P)-dependent dehydrogenase (short-subunit alcohol dehydrogenase family)
MLSFPTKFNLSGKTVLITGAAGLLGQEHALALLECDASVVLTDTNGEALKEVQDKLLELLPGSSIDTFMMDVTSKDSILKVADALEQSDRIVDVLINNAAVDPKVDSQDSLLNQSLLENFPLEQWNFQVGVGLTGAFLCSQVFGTRMVLHGTSGVILNIASDLSVFSPDQRIYRKKGLSEDQQPVKPVSYSVIKTGLVGLTRYLATYWADKGIRCNALSPGGVNTGQDEEFVQKLTSLIPLGRMANRDEYRSAIQFLCSDASAYMNGQNIVMDGGRSVW